MVQMREVIQMGDSYIHYIYKHQRSDTKTILLHPINNASATQCIYYGISITDKNNWLQARRLVIKAGLGTVDLIGIRIWREARYLIIRLILSIVRSYQKK